MLKKICALTIAAAMCFSALSLTAFADETATAAPQELASEAQAIGEGVDVMPGAAGKTEPADGVDSVEAGGAAREEVLLSSQGAEDSTPGDFDEDDFNLVSLIVVLVALVVVGVSITILSRKKRV